MDLRPTVGIKLFVLFGLGDSRPPSLVALRFLFGVTKPSRPGGPEVTVGKRKGS